MGIFPQITKAFGFAMLAAQLVAVNGFAATGGIGVVSGAVLDENGKPVERARVYVSQALPPASAKQSAPPVQTGALVATGMTDNLGAFTIPGLGAGAYIACAEPPRAGLLNPCHWDTVAPGFTVSSGQTTVGIKVVLANGAQVPIHLSDPSHLLKPAKGAVEADCRIHLITTNGRHHEARVVGHDIAGRDYVVTVPDGTPYRLLVISPQLRVNGASGLQADTATTGMPVLAGSSAVPVLLTVTGVKP